MRKGRVIKILSTFIAIVLSFSCLFVAPASAFADEYQEDVSIDFESAEIESSEIVHSDVAAMAEEIESLEVISEEVIQEIEETYGDVSIEMLDDSFAIVTIEPYAPSATENRFITASDFVGLSAPVAVAPVNEYEKIALLVSATAKWVGANCTITTGVVATTLIMYYDEVVVDNLVYRMVTRGTSQANAVYDGFQIYAGYNNIFMTGRGYGSNPSSIIPSNGWVFVTGNNLASFDSNLFSVKTVYPLYYHYFLPLGYNGSTDSNVMLEVCYAYTRGSSWGQGSAHINLF